MDGRERAAAAMLLVENSCMGTRPAGGGNGRAGKRERAAAMLVDNSCMGIRPAGGGDGRTRKSSGGDAAC